MENTAITDSLIETYGFTRSRKTGDNASRNPLTDGDCYIRVHDMHYIIWNEALKHFSIAVRHEIPKARAGGETGEWSEIILPVVAYSITQARSLLKFLGL